MDVWVFLVASWEEAYLVDLLGIYDTSQSIRILLHIVSVLPSTTFLLPLKDVPPHGASTFLHEAMDRTILV